MASDTGNQPSTESVTTNKSSINPLPTAATRAQRQAEANGSDKPVDLSALGTLLNHSATQDLEHRLGSKISAVFEKLFAIEPSLIRSAPAVAEAPYDFICVKSLEVKPGAMVTEKRTCFTRYEMHMLLYTYIFKRASAIALAEEEGCRFKDHRSRTDKAFVRIWRELILRPDLHIIANVPSSYKTVMIESTGLVKAIDIVSKLPMKFSIEKDEQTTKDDQVVAFWFEDVEPKGCWNTTWEYMGESLASIVCPGKDYEF